MACYYPLRGYQQSAGAPLSFGKELPDSRRLFIRCGQCIGCRLDRARHWAIRCEHERQLWKRNCFVTLTYDDAHYPVGGSLVYRDFQLFMKRLRKAFKDPIRFFMCGEYGENFGRPHYHACLFNCDFDDKLLFNRSPQYNLYVSDSLKELWPYGFTTVGDLNFQTAAYTARYVCDKVTGDNAEAWYTVVDKDTGEICERVPEFCHMSLKPGIGSGWFDKYAADVYPHGKVVINGKQVNPPRYYDKKFEALDEEKFEELCWSREKFAHAHVADSTWQRLAVREVVARAKLNQVKRNSI